MITPLLIITIGLSLSPAVGACVKTKGGTAEEGACCKFPLEYDGTAYYACTSLDSNKPWCATTLNYAKDNLWGYCPPPTPPPPTATTSTCQAKLKLKKAAMSSSRANYPARYAIAGESNGYCARTPAFGSHRQWWKAELSTMAIIDTVHISIGENNHRLQIWTAASSTGGDWALCKNLGNTLKQWIEVRCPRDTRGKHIKITAKNVLELKLCKVEVYGNTLQPPPAALTTLYTSTTIQFGKPLTTLKVLGQEYSLTFEFRKPTTAGAYLIQFIYDFSNYDSGSVDSIPDVWFTDDSNQQPRALCARLGIQKSICLSSATRGSVLKMGWQSVWIIQFKVNSEYRWQMFVDNEMVESVQKREPVEFKNVKVYYGFESGIFLRKLVIKSKV